MILKNVKKIKAIIFDWGGVLIDNPAPDLMDYCAQALRVSVEKFEKAFQKHESYFQKGEIPENVFWDDICFELNIKNPISNSLWGEAFKYVYSPKKEMFFLASSLKNKGYNILLIK